MKKRRTIREHLQNTQAIMWNNREIIHRENSKMLRRMTSLTECVAAGLLLMCIFFKPWAAMLNTYVVFFAINTVCVILAYLVTERHPKIVLTLGVFYFVSLVTYGTIQVVGNGDKGGTMTAFCIILLLMPMLILIDELMTDTMALLICVVFSILAWKFLPMEDAVSCTIDAFGVVIMGAVTGHFVRSIRLNDMENQRLLRIERDHDALTGLLNRRCLFEKLECNDAQSDTVYGVLIIDIDHFKWYNDTYGHLAGDRCLRQVGECLMTFAEQQQMTAYRFGGEEFVLLSNNGHAGFLQEKAQRLLRSVTALSIEHKANDGGILTVSIGGAGGRSSGILVNAADKALYKAKSDGRNRVCIQEEYSEDI